MANLGQCIFFGQEMLGEGQGGGHALMMSPDAWHTNALRLYCGSQVLPMPHFSLPGFRVASGVPLIPLSPTLASVPEEP